MALRKIAQRVPFAGGIETKMDSKQVPLARLLTLENAVFTKAISLSKRNGYASLSDAIENSEDRVTGAVRLGARGDELLAFTRNRCYSQRSSGDQWSDTGAVFSATSSDRPLVRTGTMQTMPDHATASGVTVCAWEDSRGGVWWSTVDAITGRVFRAPTQADSGGSRPRCVAVGAVLHVYYAVPSSRRIDVLVVNPTTPSAAVTAIPLLVDLSSTNPVYDAVPTDRTGTPALMAWAEHGSSNFRVGFIDASGALGSPATGHPSIVNYAALMQSASPIACAWQDTEDDEIGVTWVENDGDLDVRAALFSTQTGSIVNSAVQTTHDNVTDVDRLACAFAAEVGADGEIPLWIVAEESAVAASNRYCITNWASLAGVGTEQTIRSVALASRAFHVGEDSDVFAVLVHDTTYFNTYFVLRLSDFTCAGRILPALADGTPARSHLPSVHVDGDTIALCLPYRERLLSENADKFTETGVRLVEIDFADDDSHVSTVLGRGLYLAGACPQHYDGRVWSELGFHVGPEEIESLAGSSGGSLTAGTRVYRAWYEWTDAQGEIHRGPTSIGTRVVLTSETEVTLTLPMLRITQKSNVRIHVARSIAGDETRLWRVTSADPSASGPNGYVENDPTVDTVTFVDRMSDTDLQTQEPLYTNGGILSNDPAPLGAVVAGGKSRLFFTDPGDPHVVRYSQTLDPGYGVECPPDLAVPIDPFGGNVRALAVDDGIVFVFKDSAIYAFNGEGPLPNGDTSSVGFSFAEKLTSDVGCTDPASIAVTPVGLMFKSAKGIYLLGRDRSVEYVGAPVERYNAQSVRRATVMPDRTQIVFLTDSGKTLLFDHYYKQWSTFTNHEGRDAAVVSGVYHYLRTDERVFRETLGAYSDAGTRIRMRLETAWIRFQDTIQGFERFYHMHVIGDRMSAHQLVVQFRTDFTPHWRGPAVLDATGLPAGTTGWLSGTGVRPIGEEPLSGSVYGEGIYGDGPYGGEAPGMYGWRAHIGVVGQAIQFRFEDYEAAGFAGAGFELSELLITGGVKGPARKPYSSARST